MHVDDTTLPLLERGHRSTRTAQLCGLPWWGRQYKENDVWVDHPSAAVFEFAESRAGAHPLLYLNEYKDYLQADAYSGRGTLYERGDIIEVRCWGHCRRRFFQIAEAQKGLVFRPRNNFA